MNLVIDIGNTLSKAAIFDEKKKKVSIFHQTTFTAQEIDALIKKYNVKKGIYSTVREDDASKMLTKFNFLILNEQTPLPLTNLYETPETQGKDRIAAAVGGSLMFKNKNVLIVDMGTCVTYDFVNNKNEYLGGAISPGFEMRFKALHHFTKKLPLIHFNQHKIDLIGNSTENSILSGVYNGLKHEILATIQSYEKQYNNLKIVLTGGDYNLFDFPIKNRIFADKFIVLKGLNEILIYNAE